MNLYALTVGHNEADRYLGDMLASVHGVFDGHFFFDDRSIDATVHIAREAGCEVLVRPEMITPFIVHEGEFRQAAWWAFEAAFRPAAGDWVLAIDCDELLIGGGDLRSALQMTAAAARQREAVAALVRIPEVWGLTDGGAPLVRVDGLWDTIAGTRFFEYRPGGMFSGKAMGSGSEPTYVTTRPAHKVTEWCLCHYGYAHVDDQRAKWARYSQLIDHGHADAHVRSIGTTPTLRPWPGPWKPVHRGAPV